MSDLSKLLDSFRKAAVTEREKGTYFERLAVHFIKHDPGMTQEYEDAWLFSDWAKEHGKQFGLDGRDTGIDAVAKIRDEDGFCAIQCKFYREGYRIQKGDINSFLSSSRIRPFTRGLIIDTTGAPWSEHAEAMLGPLDIQRIGLDRLEESPIDWAIWFETGEARVTPRKTIKPHQIDALNAVRAGLAEQDRGKLIMACGTGKTYTGLKIAEDQVGTGGYVLVLVPSLALMSQTIREWTIDSSTPLRSFAVCSDTQVGKRRKSKDDLAEVDVHDLDYPATTSAVKLASRAHRPAPERMTVVFATYQSIQVISDAQKQHGLNAFDLIICDEAHRTTGATLAGDNESAFVKVHNQDFIAGKKRLYMTATPRVFGDAIKAKANEVSAVLASMDDEALYGQTLFTRGFGWAVENRLLTDYKVLVLAVDEAMVSASVQNRLAEGSELKLDDATKIIGCYKALVKSGLTEELTDDSGPMRRALAFAKDIKSSKLIQDEFAAVVREYIASDEGKEALGSAPPLACELRHVDGTMGAKERTSLLDWLKAENDDACRILTNARCLSEGVDVPALDAVLFMHPRKSQVDVVQSVGRVMRRADGKRMGYVILPIGVPANKTPEEALNDNERYRVVWQILNALRSHDERFDAMINKADLGVDISDHIEVIAVSNRLPSHSKQAKMGIGIGQGSQTEDDDSTDGDSTPRQSTPFQTAFAFDEFTRAIMAKIVKKCGRRTYWEDWASDIAKIAQAHISRIKGLVEKPNTPEREAFGRFLSEIRDDLNEKVTEDEAIEMLAQHLITQPVFEALFEGYSFAEANPVSRAMQNVLETLRAHRIEKEAEKLEGFYASVKRRAAGIDNDAAKQRIVVELYDKFFRNAFPKMTDRLGIVYTPVEIVDFILHSVNELLQSEFGQTLGSEGVHILDPFTGTGTFITRLIQSGLISHADLARKYATEIHANDIILLAYYIAAINIEAAYHDQMGGDYRPFEGICLTDTFQLYEQERDLIADLMVDNSNRRERQRRLPVRVIVGNPPYSDGQESENDNAKNIDYPKLDDRIAQTYEARSSAKLRTALYNSYIRAIRWASDRIGEAGVIGFVTNAGWVDGKAADGLRKSLITEFSNIYVFHLRGNQRTSGERSRQEGGKVFGSGSRAPIAITFLVKNPNAHEHGKILFHDIGNYKTKDEKLAIVHQFKSLNGVSKAQGWKPITPDKHGDWLGQRDKGFDRFILIGENKVKGLKTVFSLYSGGVKTNRDNWAFNPSRNDLEANMRRMIDTYNAEVKRFGTIYGSVDRKARMAAVDDFVESDPAKISWSGDLKDELVKGKKARFRAEAIAPSLYRPFTRQWLYFDRQLNNSIYQMPRLFPMGHAKLENRVIMLKQRPPAGSQFALMTNVIPELQTDGGTQCFPRWVYDERAVLAGDDLALEDQLSGDSPVRRDAITDVGIAHFRAAYPGEEITKDDLFYYVYGLMHSSEYRIRYADNLSKQLPRIPAVKRYDDFRAFVDAGQRLGDLHCDYDDAELYPVTIAQGDLRLANIPNPASYFRVEKMRFGGKRPNLDKSTVMYNANITLTGIPLDAYEYIVNGKPALEWVMERQSVKTDKDSGITWDANAYANETMGDPTYPLKLFQRVITVSLETMKIVRSLPRLDLQGD
ncbi:DEAD/DEAH box helicase [Ferrovibrio sp.]|uniref:DEAD/DEAH box helicase n=1 Tax=Ferrovibrio sp. TaxID=1917215 RepID=UPI0035128152